MEYNDVELRQLKVVHVEVPSVPNFMDISMVDQAICDTGVYTKIWKESHRDQEAPMIVSSRDQLRADQN